MVGFSVLLEKTITSFKLFQYTLYMHYLHVVWFLVVQEMERLENQPCEWDDHMLAQALESEQRRELEEQRQQEEEEFKKLQV